MVPHKRHGTHTILYNKIIGFAFYKEKARKSLTYKTKIMTNKNKQETLARFSKHDNIFHLVKDKNEKVNILVGNYKVSQKTFDTFEQADNYIGTKPYELIFTTCNVMTNTIIQNEKEKQKDMAKEPTKETKANV